MIQAHFVFDSDLFDNITYVGVIFDRGNSISCQLERVLYFRKADVTQAIPASYFREMETEFCELYSRAKEDGAA
jgi:hypothetical protein